MRVAFFTEGVDIPASRFRCEQFFPHFERAGIRCEMFYGYDGAYNAVHRRRIAPLYKVAFRGRRALSTLTASGFDLLFFQRTAYPFTALPEQLRSLLGARTIFDFDDLLHVGPGGRPSALRTRAFLAATRSASHVVAGNAFLASLTDVPTKTSIIPTVVDTEHYRPAERERGPTLRLGWMGTSGNFSSLRTVLPAVLEVLARRPHVRFRVVTNARLPELEGHPQVEQFAWSRAEEVAHLQSFDVGLMPLADTEANRGKCGFKMIQYFATGAAVVASSVGANGAIFKGSGAGLLVEPGVDWTPALLKVTSSADPRATYGRSGRVHAEKHYSVQAAAPLYLALFEQLVRGRTRGTTHAH